MSPLVRGRFFPQVESSGPVKPQLDILLWTPSITQANLAVLDSIEVLRSYLRSVEPCPCSIRFWVPACFCEIQTQIQAIGISSRTVPASNADPRTNSILDAAAPQEIREIISTMFAVDADLVVVSDPAWYPYAPDFEELGSFLATYDVLKRQCEIFVRGHDVPWSFEFPIWSRPWNGFYNLSERRTFEPALQFLERAHGRNLDRSAQELGRTLVHNRLAHLCFTRDRLLFYEMQQRVSDRLGWERQEFLFEVGYFLNFYYLLLYGGFDHLAVLVNVALGLGLQTKAVGATYEAFLTALRGKAPEIHTLFTDQKLSDFIDRVGALRHYAAHRGSIAPGKIYEQLDPEPTTADLDAEIAARGLDRSLQVVPAGPVRDSFRETLRQKLLISKSKLLADGIVFLQIRGKSYYIRPMADIEWNFERYYSFLSTVLRALNARL